MGYCPFRSFLAPIQFTWRIEAVTIERTRFTVHHRTIERELKEAEERRKLKQAEVKLREREEQLRKLSYAIVITDPHGAVEYVNPKFTGITGNRLYPGRGYRKKSTHFKIE
ncbi:MAG: hypothetical protein JETT_3775 [Candidatus Jettenia ecosi]|uniref:PAS domain-containing protein n=1 Tax=Candidatus Jettenia ecosi TaxID=2494326 RepID=A0A533Q5Y5_9BACT|nr:MAG: hypothetical protein JETT_3775 [Candidatus Jettenia ecosi]